MHRRNRLVPLAVVAILIAFAASASAASRTGTLKEDQPHATEAAPSNATVQSLTKRVKRLQKQVKSLGVRVATLEDQEDPGGQPSGPAGGDLTGSYPNPTIANNIVGPEKIPDETLTGFEIAPNTLYANDLATGSVGSTELKGLHVVVSAGVTVPAQGARDESAFCPAGEQAISGGGAFQHNEASFLGSTPSLSARNRWDVRGRAFGSPNTLYAWALCLPA